MHRCIVEVNDRSMTMKKLFTGLAATTLLMAIQPVFADQEGVLDRKGDRIENRLDRRGDIADNKLDRQGSRINRQMDYRSDRAAEYGYGQRAEHLDMRGDRIERRLDVRGDVINRRLDRQGRFVDRRLDVAGRRRS